MSDWKQAVLVDLVAKRAEKPVFNGSSWCRAFVIESDVVFCKEDRGDYQMPGGPVLGIIWPAPTGQVYLEHEHDHSWLRDTKTHERILRIAGGPSVDRVAWSGDGRHLMLSMGDGRIGIVELPPPG